MDTANDENKDQTARSVKQVYEQATLGDLNICSSFKGILTQADGKIEEIEEDDKPLLKHRQISEIL